MRLLRNKFVLAFITLVLAAGCSPKEKPAVVIGEIKISASEFNSAFERSAYSASLDMESRKKFSDEFIDRKLILKEAQKLGLDKDSEFLNDVQSFWEQSLLKLAIDRKLKEIASAIKVTDQDVKDYFAVHKDRFEKKSILQVYELIKLELFTIKQREALDDWIESLRKKSKVTVSRELLESGQKEK